MAASTYDFDPQVRAQIESLKKRLGVYTAKAAIQRAVSITLQLVERADPELGTIIVSADGDFPTVISIR